MNFKKTLVFVLLIIGFLNVQAQAKLQPDASHGKQELSDTIRDEFNLKKKNTASLISGKDPDTILDFYELYLKEKDQVRADSLMFDILKSTKAIGYRHNLSLISYRYTSDTRTKMLFLSDSAKIKEYRTFFIKYKVSTLKSNSDKRAHYYDLVALDSAYYKIAPDTLLSRQMGDHYNSLAWSSILNQKLSDVAYYLNQSIKYNPQSKYPHSNMALLLLLEGHYQKARAMYIKLKDIPFDGIGTTFKDVFLEDFMELSEAGITNNDINKIKILLNSKQK